MKNLFKFLFLIGLFAGCNKSDKVIKPLVKDITQAVYASGKIYPVNHYNVISKLPGYIQQIQVKVGDTVKLGQPLITIRSEVSDFNVSTAKNLYDLARQNADENSPMLTSMKQDVLSAKTKFELDSLNFNRYTNLEKSNAVSKITYDQAKVQFEISKQNYVKAINNLSNTRQRLKVELLNAQNQYEAQQVNKNDYVILSEINGKIYDVMIKEGAFVTQQLPLLEVGDASKFEVELMVDETDIELIKKNQEIAYSIDAIHNRIFKGNIAEIYPRINQLNKTAKVISSIDFGNSNLFYSGISVEANIIISQKKNALVIPREYLVDNSKVKLKEGKKIVGIDKGIEDLEYVEVLSGIDEETEIMRP